MDSLTTQQKKDLYLKLKRDVIALDPYGFFSKDSHWQKFAEKTFFRSGTLEQEHYSGTINMHLSTAALLHTLTQIDTMLKQLLEQE